MTRGRPPLYPFRTLEIGQSFDIEVPTGADVKRMCRNASNYGERHEVRFSCKTNRTTRVMTITRIPDDAPKYRPDVPDHLKEEYRHLIRSKEYRAQEAAALLGIK